VRSFGLLIPELVLTKMNPCRNRREGKMGRARNGKSPLVRKVMYIEQDISERSKAVW